MATIRKRRGKFGVSWRAEVYVKGRRLSATFDTQAQAASWAENTEYLLRSGLPLPGEAQIGDMFFVEAANRYIAEVAPRKKANTRRLDEEIGKRLIARFGEKTLAGIKPADVAAYRDHRLRSVGPSSVIQDLSFLRCLYQTARVDWGLAVANPTADIRRPAAPKHRLALLTPPEIDRLLDWCCISKAENLYCYTLLMLHTAMRPSEAAGLRWQQVQEHIIDLTETKTEPRRVPLTETAQAMLAELRTRRPPGNPFVFLPDDGRWRALPHRFFRRSFASACRYAGINGFTLYGLRHSSASYLIMHGVDIRTVAEIMGHRNISQTMKYTHFLDAHKLRAIAAIDRLGR